MAYFANSTEGSILDKQCAECIIPDDAPCPILSAQMTYNYDQCRDGQENLRDCLNMLVSDDGGICLMKQILDKLTAEGIERRQLENAGQINFLRNP